MNDKKSLLGTLRYRIGIEDPVETNPVEDGGGLDRNHVQKQSLWADVRPLSTNSKFEHFVQNIVATHQVTVRKNSIIRVGTRLTWESRVLVVKSEGASSREYQYFTCEEVPTNA